MANTELSPDKGQNMIRNNPLRVHSVADTSLLRTQFLWLSIGLFVVLGLTSLGFFGLSRGMSVSLVLFGTIAVIAGYGLSKHPIKTLGAANVVTTMRAGMIAFLASCIAQPDVLNAYGWFFFAVASLAFALDGVDGFLARRDGTATSYGARYDMEIDALFGAVLSLIVLSAGIAGPLVLILGFMRYIFVLAGYALPWLNGSLPESMRRKGVCVIQIAALIALICPVIPTSLQMTIMLTGTAALVWSFAIDTLRLKRLAT
ncbi:MAG: CDP-alcohol phosphatidyltransferase family protein [Paracoccaceae bacterium]